MRLPLICSSIPVIGFTLTELMITLTVAGILAALAVPSMSRFIESNRLTTVTNEFLADINVARAEAVKRGVPAVLCESTTGSGCTTSGSWAGGWILFADADDNSVWSTGDAMVRTQPAAPANITITNGAAAVVFNRLGTVDSGASVYQICNTKIGVRRDVEIRTVGRAELREETCP